MSESRETRSSIECKRGACCSLGAARMLSGEGNGNPLQCSCLENPRDSRGWWAAIYGVAQSWTRLKQLSSSSRMLSVGIGGSGEPDGGHIKEILA